VTARQIAATNHAYTIGRTMAAVELLADAPRSPTELARTLQVHPRTARRLLERLAYDGYVLPAPERGGRYLATPQLVDLGDRARRQLAVSLPQDSDLWL
jgi:DNA-binding IclR family transcriptional regulator